MLNSTFNVHNFNIHHALFEFWSATRPSGSEQANCAWGSLPVAEVWSDVTQLEQPGSGSSRSVLLLRRRMRLEIMEDNEPIHPAVLGLKTVCRCNNIKYRTIERAIREGARCLDDVAAKTTATTGHCGGSCTPVVQDMIEDLGAGK